MIGMGKPGFGARRCRPRCCLRLRCSGHRTKRRLLALGIPWYLGCGWTTSKSRISSISPTSVRAPASAARRSKPAPRSVRAMKPLKPASSPLGPPARASMPRRHGRRYHRRHVARHLRLRHHRGQPRRHRHGGCAYGAQLHRSRSSIPTEASRYRPVSSPRASTTPPAQSCTSTKRGSAKLSYSTTAGTRRPPSSQLPASL